MVVRQICGTNVSASKKKHKLLLSYVHYSATLNLKQAGGWFCYYQVDTDLVTTIITYIFFRLFFQIVTSPGICCKIGQSVGSAIRFSKYLGSPPSQKEEEKKELTLNRRLHSDLLRIRDGSQHSRDDSVFGQQEIRQTQAWREEILAQLLQIRNSRHLTGTGVRESILEKSERQRIIHDSFVSVKASGRSAGADLLDFGIGDTHVASIADEGGGCGTGLGLDDFVEEAGVDGGGGDVSAISTV